MLKHKHFKKLVSKQSIIVLLFVSFALIASIQALTLKPRALYDGGKEYNRYNNYTIFERSFHHLIEDKDLYILYPEEHWDLYKYSPSFAALFGVFALLPDSIGLVFWNLINALVLLASIYYLPKITQYQKGLIAIIFLIELLTSMQNEQSNALIAGLIVLSFGLLEKGKYLIATLCIVLSVYIKPFGIVAFSLFLFYPQKWKLAAYTLLWTSIIALTPLLFISQDQYGFLLNSWTNMLANDHSASYGYSVMGILHSWLGIAFDKLYVVILAAIIFLIPLIKLNEYKNYPFRLITLASILIWIVIFNHKAESPTFIIAMTGVAIWFVLSKKNILNIALFIFAFILTSLSPTDLFPAGLRNEYVNPYMLKALPCILIWFNIIYNMLFSKRPLPLIGSSDSHQITSRVA